MTTVAYRAGIIAADRLVSGQNIREGQMTKIAKRGRVLAGAAGNCDMISAFLQWVESGCQGDPPQDAKPEDNPDAFMVVDGRIIIVTSPRMFEMTADFYAVGSGSQIALGAMAMGASATRAVRIASRFDVYTGREVDVLKATNG